MPHRRLDGGFMNRPGFCVSRGRGVIKSAEATTHQTVNIFGWFPCVTQAEKPHD